MNSLALPLVFGDPTPWAMGFDYIYPSLIVHIVYGASIGITACRFARRSERDWLACSSGEKRSVVRDDDDRGAVFGRKLVEDAHDGVRAK